MNVNTLANSHLAIEGIPQGLMTSKECLIFSFHRYCNWCPKLSNGFTVLMVKLVCQKSRKWPTVLMVILVCQSIENDLNLNQQLRCFFDSRCFLLHCEVWSTVRRTLIALTSKTTKQQQHHLIYRYHDHSLIIITPNVRHPGLVGRGGGGVAASVLKFLSCKFR